MGHYNYSALLLGHQMAIKQNRLWYEVFHWHCCAVDSPCIVQFNYLTTWVHAAFPPDND